MRPLTSIIAAATLGTKPETSAFGDWSLLIAGAAACDLTPLSGQKFNSVRLCRRFGDGRRATLASIHGRDYG
jgi:hypothetical protein